MNDDIKKTDGTSAESPDQGGSLSFLKKKLPSKLFPYMTVGTLLGIAIAAFVIGLAIALSAIKWREPITPTYAGGYSGGSLGCYLDDGAFTDITTVVDADWVIGKVGSVNKAALEKPGIKDALNKVIETSKASGVNPAILISFWGAEQSFGNPDKAFGCYVNGKADIGIENSTLCALEETIKPLLKKDYYPTQVTIDGKSFTIITRDEKDPSYQKGRPTYEGQIKTYSNPADANLWDRLLYNYVAPTQTTYNNFKYTTDKSNARIQILKKIVPDEVVCRNAEDGSFAFPEWGFKQEDKKWKDYPYNKPTGCKGDLSATIGSSGCGPTSLAMVLKKYGIDTTPPQVVRDILGMNGRACTGTSYSALEGIPEKYGLTTSTVYNWSVAKAALESGKTVITSMKSSSYAEDPSRKSGGHIIVLMGINEQGDILVNDPYRNYTKTTDAVIEKASKGIFIIVGPKSST